MKAIFYVLIATLAISCMNVYGQDLSKYKFDPTGRNTDADKVGNKLEQTRKEAEQAARAGKGHSQPRANQPAKPPRGGYQNPTAGPSVTTGPVEYSFGGSEIEEQQFFATPSSSANENKALSSLLVGDNKPQSASGGLEVEVKASGDEIRGYVGKSGSPVNLTDMKVNVPPSPTLDESPLSISRHESDKEWEHNHAGEYAASVKPNGCGTEKIDVPDFIFKEACDLHDLDYAKGVPRLEADRNFLVNMEETCRSVFLPYTIMGYTQCVQVANMYYFGVRLFGQEAYDNARIDRIAHLIAARQQVQAKNVHVEQKNGNIYIAVERRPMD